MFSLNSLVASIQASPRIQSSIYLADSVGKFAIVFALVSYIAEYPDRAKQRYFQAWQVINSAHNSSGDGGRRTAITDLIAGNSDLRLIDLSYAGLEHFDFRGANMPDAKFNNAVLVDSHFDCRASWLPSWIPMLGECQNTVLTRAFIGGSEISPAQTDAQADPLRATGSRGFLATIESADFSHAQMNASTFQNAVLAKNVFDEADLSDSFFSSITFAESNSFKGTHLERAHFSHMGFRAPEAGGKVNLDFTGAILTDATLDGKPLSPEALTKDVVKLCKTQFSSSQTSNRDC